MSVKYGFSVKKSLYVITLFYVDLFFIFLFTRLLRFIVWYNLGEIPITFTFLPVVLWFKFPKLFMNFIERN